MGSRTLTPWPGCFPCCSGVLVISVLLEAESCADCWQSRSPGRTWVRGIQETPRTPRVPAAATWRWQHPTPDARGAHTHDLKSLSSQLCLNFWSGVCELPRTLPFDVIVVVCFSTHTECHIWFQVHMQGHTCIFSAAQQEEMSYVFVLRCRRVQTIIVTWRIALFPTQKTSVMDNRLSNQLEERKPIGIKTWLDSHQAVTTVPRAWL